MENAQWATEKATETTTHILVRSHNYCWNCYLLPMSTFIDEMKLIFAVLDVSLTMGLTRCYKTEGFLHLLIIIIITAFV